MRVALLTDVHEDLVSLGKAFRLIEIEKCDQIVFIGDMLGYPFMRGKYADTRSASGCIAMIRSSCSLVLTGNHDIFHLRKFPEYVNGFRFPRNWYDLSPAEMTELSKGRVWNYSDDYPVNLSDRDREYLSSLPEYAVKDIGGKRVLFSHYLYPNLTGFVAVRESVDKALEGHFGFMADHGCELSVCGHMHIEGLGIAYETGDSLLPKLFRGFMYYSYGLRRPKNRRCCVTIPALADNSQVNGFAIFDSTDFSINVLSLNTNRRFIL